MKSWHKIVVITCCLIFYTTSGVCMFGMTSTPPAATPGFPDATHLKLIRKLHLFWSPVESGSPWVNCIEPLGEGDTGILAAEITGLPVEAARKKLIETAENLYTFIQKAQLKPGVYLLSEHLDAPYGEEFGVAAEGSFTLTQEHLTLLRHMRWHWPSPQAIPELLAEGIYPFPLTESKRPYGDFTWYEYEMAEILGEPYALGPDGNAVKDPEKDKRMEALHHETLPALQALFLYGEMP